MRLLLVEDEARLAGQIKGHLEHQAFAVEVAPDGETALALARNAYDCVLLDLGLPGTIDGMEVCRTLRAVGNQVPILILTARDALTARVAGLDSGADDYVVKPFALEELAARVRALLRRPRGAHPVTLRVADLALDTASRTAERGGRRISFTAREYAMLELLMRHAGTVLDRAEISRHVWDDNYDPASNIIDVYINRLRAKIDRDFAPKLLHTLRGQGYVCRAQAPGL
ncbi:MAG TPA: response regulator transcription factor [Gemmatimonadales bacterium]|nr:response regulator transcription factor [Gemmatimonadales bacterium]